MIVAITQLRNGTGLTTARAAEVGFSPFFCLSHSRTFGTARITLSTSPVPVLARAVKIEVAPRGLAGSNYLSEEHYQQARQRDAEDKY